MRIAVCAPQVPFVRGGAEIFADKLVDELRKRDHEVELVTVPLSGTPARASSHRRFSGVCSTSTRLTADRSTS